MNILKLSSPGKIWFGFYVVVIILLIYKKERDQSTMNVFIWLILLLTKLQNSILQLSLFCYVKVL